MPTSAAGPTARLRLPVRTERLSLRVHDRSDADWLHRIYSQPEVARYLLEEPWTLDHAAEQVEKRVARTGLDGDPGQLALVIEHQAQPVGDLAIWLTERDRRVAEIGWVLDPVHRGQGFAREAVACLLDLAFGTYGLHRVIAQMDARNSASARLAEAVGMRREAHLRQDWWSKGEWTDTYVYGALWSDPRGGARPSGTTAAGSQGPT